MAAPAQRDPVREVRLLREQDLRGTAALHAVALPDSFFVRLGPGFLRAYHRTFMVSPHARGWSAVADGRVEGFLLAVVDPARHGAYVLRRLGVRLALRGLAALLVRPAVLLVFLRTRLLRYAKGLWRRRKPASGQTATVAGQWTVLSHIAVDEGARGRGVAPALVQELHAAVRSAGATGVVLLTTPEGPGPRFYERLDYERDGAVTGADGGQWLRYRRRLA